MQNLSRESRPLHSKQAVASRSGMQKLLKLNRCKTLISISLSFPRSLLSLSFRSRPLFHIFSSSLVNGSANPSLSFSWQVVYKINGGKSCLLWMLLSFRSRRKPFNYPLSSIIFARYRSTIKSASIYQSSLRAV